MSQVSEVCEDCFTGALLPGEPTGSMTSIGSQQAYYKPGNAPTDRKAIIILPDIFGLASNNHQIIADQLAQETGFDVYVLDYFNGSPPVDVNQMLRYLPQTPGIVLSTWKKLKFYWTLLPTLPAIKANRPPVLSNRTTDFITNLQKEKSYAKLGVVGYCLGGKVAILIAQAKLIDSVVILHPGGVEPDEARKILVPSSWVWPEEESQLTPQMRDEIEAALKEKSDNVAFESKIYKGTTHGFASRPNLTIPEIKDAYHGALEQSAKWLTSTL
ncbi:hypothetical protein FRC02_006573 [Tulasnella sp. 418]|nr:hypothetical protein FRC02_006573 [Tulasnella sp. 418]